MSVRPLLVPRAAAAVAVLSAFVALSVAAPPVVPAATPPAPSTTPAPAVTSGRWQGEIAAKAGKEGAATTGSIFCLVELTTENGTPHVLLTIPTARALRSPAKDVVVKGDTLAFSFESMGVTGRFRGVVKPGSPEGPRRQDGVVQGGSQHDGVFAGSLTLGRAGNDPDDLDFSLVDTPRPASIEGHARYETELELPGAKLPMAFTVAAVPPTVARPSGYVGSVDIPLQGLVDYPMVVTSVGDEDGRRLWTFRIPVGIDAVLEVIEREDSALHGRFKQGSIDLPVVLTKSVGKVAADLKRPQMPKPPFPYEERQVVIPHRFGHSLAGTLLVPERTPDSPTRFPAVVLISGSGPQDRDESLMGHKPFLVLADALARAGIAVLRYDDRGIGGSTGDFAQATSYHFATDADEASEWLKRQPEIDATRVGLVGHSEGALIAPIVAAWQWSQGLGSPWPIAFMALLAGPGVNGSEILKLQLRRLMEAEGVAAAEVEVVSAAQARLLELMAAEHRDLDAVRQAARTLAQVQMQIGKSEAERAAIPESEIEQATNQVISQIANPWMDTFLTLEPSGWLAASPIPILAMNGDLDLQVDADQNLPAIRRAVAAGLGALTTKRYPGLNHLFQPAKTGSVSEYATIETTFDPAALADLVQWIVDRGKEAPRSRADLKDLSAPSRRPVTVEEIGPIRPAPAAPSQGTSSGDGAGPK